MPITAVIIVTSAVHVRIPTIRPAAVVDSHVSCSVRSGGSDRTQKGEKKRSEQYQLQQTVPGVKPLPQRIGTAYPITRFAVAHLHILDKGPSHVQKQTHKARWMNRYPRCLGSPQKKLTSDFERPQSQSSQRPPFGFASSPKGVCHNRPVVTNGLCPRLPLCQAARVQALSVLEPSVVFL